MYFFRKEERLCSRSLIDLLYKDGSSFFLYPFRVKFFPIEVGERECRGQILIVVPKRNFKKSVDRNLLKRRIKESYRLRKFDNFYSEVALNKQVLLSLQYVAKTKEPFELIHKKMKAVLIKVMEEIKTIDSHV